MSFGCSCVRDGGDNSWYPGKPNALSDLLKKRGLDSDKILDANMSRDRKIRETRTKSNFDALSLL